MGRFISRDPIDIADDVNLYAYVANNPVMYTDRMGLEKQSTVWYKSIAKDQIIYSLDNTQNAADLIFFASLPALFTPAAPGAAFTATTSGIASFTIGVTINVLEKDVVGIGINIVSLGAGKVVAQGSRYFLKLPSVTYGNIANRYRSVDTGRFIKTTVGKVSILVDQIGGYAGGRIFNLLD